MGNRNRIYFALMLLIPVCFLELSLQAYYRISNGNFLFQRVNLSINSPDIHRVYRTKPNLTLRQRTNEFDVTYYTNSQGLRTDSQRKEIKIDKPADTYRILFLGPSFAFGWANNYEDTYVSIISEAIAAVGKSIEVMNLGTPGQPISYQFCWLQEEGYKYRPDMIVQTVYGDPTKTATRCDIPADHPTVHNGYLYNSTDSFKVNFLSVVKNSAIVFYGWYIYQFMLSGDDKNIGLGTELYGPDSEVSPSEDYGSKVAKYRENIVFVWQVVQREIPIVFLHVPFSYVVRPGDLSRWTVQNPKDPLQLLKAAREMEILLNREGILFVNPTDELISKDKETRTYYFLDLHFTPAGNKVLAGKAIPIIQKVINLDRDEERD